MSLLKIKQTTKDGRSKVWKLDSSTPLHTFGLSRKAQIVSIDSEHDKYQAAFEYRDGKWHVIQFGSNSETPSILIEKSCVLEIKNSKIECDTNEIKPFVTSSLDSFKASGKGNQKNKLLMVLNNGVLLRTEVKPIQHQFTYMVNGELKKINFKPSEEWQSQNFENYTFKSKVIDAEDLRDISSYTDNEKLGKENKLLVFAVLAFFTLIMGIGVFGPKPETKIAEPTPPPQTVVVKLDPKKIEQMKKKQGESAPKVAASAAQQQPQAPTETPPPAGNKVNALIKGAVGARISQLIGKVSATDARTTEVLVTKQGTKAGEGPSGRAMAAVGNMEASGRNWTGESVGSGQGVSTAGIAGGKGAGALGNGLAAGKTGSGGVGLIEEESEVEGGLDREVIAQYIKSQLGQILYCYERQLSASPNLYGKVAVKFTITGTGQVDSQIINDTTLKSASVEGCILSKISKWKFPEPKGGTKGMVTYPFLFKSTD